MKTESKKMYRRVPERVVMAHFNDKLIACVNTGIVSCSESSFEIQPTGSPGCAPMP
jgi:hypothetical protein